MAPLDHLFRIISNVISQIVKTKLIIRAIGYIRAVSVLARTGLQKLMQNLKTAFGVPDLVCFDFGVRRIVNKARVVTDASDFKPQNVVNLTHPDRVAPGQIIVDRYYEDSFAGSCG